MLRRWSVKLALLVALVLGSLPGRALADRKEEAAKSADRGDRAFAKSDFAGALAEYTESYNKYPKPFLIFRLAECSRQLGNDADALTLYRKYMAKVTRGPDRRKAEQHADELEKKIAAAAAAAAEAGEPEPVAQQTDVEAPPMEVPDAKHKGKKLTPPQETTATAPKQDSLPPGYDPINEIHEPVPKYVEPPVWKPLYKRWWLWTAVAGGAAVVGVAIGVGLAYGLPKFTSELPVGGPGTSALGVHGFPTHGFSVRF